MADLMSIGHLSVPPETLGWTRAPYLDQIVDGQIAKAYIDRSGKPNLFPPGTTPFLSIMTVGQYPTGKKY